MSRNGLKAGARRNRAAIATLPCVALLAGCGGEDDSLFSPFDAPLPVDSLVLSIGAALPANIATLTANLLNSDFYMGHESIGWGITLYDGTVLTNLHSAPLRNSGAAFAHAAGYTGQGQTIAVSDGQYRPGYAEFSGTNVTVVNNWQGLDPNAIPSSPHGTLVSAIALGQSNDFIGTAPDANLMFGSYETDQKLADLGNAAAAIGAVAWNNSWGYPALFLNQGDFDLAFTGSSGQVNYLAALDNYASDGVVVFAVPNDNTLGHATLMDGLPFLRPSLEAGWIAAANGIATLSGSAVTGVQLLSAPCHEAARWCMIADGSWQVPDTDLRLEPDGSTLVTGSSFAAPQISGGLAILADAFPTLDPHELRVRLLASAEDSFFSPDGYVELATGFNKGYSLTYGHGFLDIEAALQPIGAPAIATASGGSVAVASPVLTASTAMGDALERGLQGTTVEVHDALSASFAMPASALATSVAPPPQAHALMARALQGDPTATRLAPHRPLAEPFGAFSGETLALTAPDTGVQASLLLPSRGETSFGVTLSQPVIEGPTRVDLGLTLARDAGGAIGLGNLGGSAAAALASVSLGLTQSLGDQAYLSLSGEMGLADLGGASALARVGTAHFNRVGFETGTREVFSSGDRLSLSVALPYALTSGTATVSAPVIRAAGAGFEDLAIGLSPTDRQVDLTLRYQRPLATGTEFSLSVAHSENFGNRSGVSDTGAAMVLSFKF